MLRTRAKRRREVPRLEERAETGLERSDLEADKSLRNGCVRNISGNKAQTPISNCITTLSASHDSVFLIGPFPKEQHVRTSKLADRLPFDDEFLTSRIAAEMDNPQRVRSFPPDHVVDSEIDIGLDDPCR